VYVFSALSEANPRIGLTVGKKNVGSPRHSIYIMPLHLYYANFVPLEAFLTQLQVSQPKDKPACSIVTCSIVN